MHHWQTGLQELLQSFSRKETITDSKTHGKERGHWSSKIQLTGEGRLHEVSTTGTITYRTATVVRWEGKRNSEERSSQGKWHKHH